MKKSKLAFMAVIIAYLIVAIGYFLGKSVIEGAGLEYRFWVEALFRVIVWFVPVLLIGVALFLTVIKRRKEGGSGRGWMVVLALYCLGAAFLSFCYVLTNAFLMTTDEKMPDGNLVVTKQVGLECEYYYAEPVGLFCRRAFLFDAEKTAESLSAIYGVSFEAQYIAGGDAVYVSEAYPGLEVKILHYGNSETSYLDCDLPYVLTSQMIEKHEHIFKENNVELVPYTFGKSEDNPEGHGTYFAVLISKENQEDAAQAVSEFIQATLLEDLRTDGESCWESVNGSIFLVKKNAETGEAEAVRNIPFSLNPENWWVFGKEATKAEVLEDIKQALD